jgi:hypothetical protein
MDADLLDMLDRNPTRKANPLTDGLRRNIAKVGEGFLVTEPADNLVKRGDASLRLRNTCPFFPSTHCQVHLNVSR